MNIKIGFIQLLPGKNLEENLMIGKKACAEAKDKGGICAFLKHPGLREFL